MTDFKEYKEYRFHVADYIVFGLMIFFSTGVGIFLAYKNRNKNENEDDSALDAGKDFGGSNHMSEYLLGSRQMAVFPTAMSLIGSYISALTILGNPPEIYNYGIQYFMIIVAILLSSILVAFIFMPVFFVLEIASSYQYLEMRFAPIIRSFASFMFVFDEILFLPFVIYMPALAFSQVSGAPLHLVSFVITSLTVLYTLLGGMKAVVYTDAWQIYVMFCSVIVVVILGLIDIGGPGKALQYADEGGRIFWNFNWNFYERLSFMAVLGGGTCYWTSFNAVNQTMVQRYVSLPTLRKGQLSLLIFTGGMMFFIFCVCTCGVLIYAVFRHCDPTSAGLIEIDDQLFPLYVMHVAGHLHGIAGLFVAGVFGAALSSLSVILNSTALVLLQDVVIGTFNLRLSERTNIIIVKSSIVLLGTLSFLMVFVLEMLDGSFGVATSLTSIAAGTTFGLFSLGMLIPWASTWGTAIGGIVGFCFTLTISMGNQGLKAAGKIVDPKLPLDVSACPKNVTLKEQDIPDMSGIFPLYRLSYLYPNAIGIFTTIMVGALASLCIKRKKMENLNADLITPVFHRFLPDICFENSQSKKKKKSTSD